MKKFFSKMDIPLLILTILLSVVGLIMIYSASSVSTVIRYGVPSYYFFVKQAIFIVAALVFSIIVILRLPTRNYSPLALPAMILIIFALGMLFVKGKITNHSQSWYDLGFFSLQPSEFAKSIYIVFAACFYDKLYTKKVKNLFAYFIPVLLGLIMAFLIHKQPDMGSTLIVLGIIGMTFLSIPFIKKHFFKMLEVGVVIVAVAALGLFASGKPLLNDMQKDRLNFKEPCNRYTKDTGYQVCNGLIAMNNGGLFGVGLGNSTQKYLYLPESHTDFIFPIIVEELGLVGGSLILLGYMIMLFRILKIAKKAETLRCAILAYGTFWYLAFHILINILGILALIPLTGLPLPLLSYGGSFTINVIVMLFVIQRVNIENNINKTRREIKAL